MFRQRFDRKESHLGYPGHGFGIIEFTLEGNGSIRLISPIDHRLDLSSSSTVRLPSIYRSPPTYFHPCSINYLGYFFLVPSEIPYFLRINEFLLHSLVRGYILKSTSFEAFDLHFCFRSIAKHCEKRGFANIERRRKWRVFDELTVSSNSGRLGYSVLGRFWLIRMRSLRLTRYDLVPLIARLLLLLLEQILVPFTKISTGSNGISLSFRSTFEMIPRTFVIGNFFFFFYFDSSSRG